MRPTRFAIPVAALLALSACDWFSDTPQEAADASGEVLPPSVSDEMIATQDLKSQPPALRVQPGEAGVTGAESAVADSAAEGAAPPAQEATPVAAPAAE